MNRSDYGRAKKPGVKPIRGGVLVFRSGRQMRDSIKLVGVSAGMAAGPLAQRTATAVQLRAVPESQR